MSLPAPTTGLSGRGRGGREPGTCEQLELQAPHVLSSHPSQPHPDTGLPPVLGPKMALEEAHGGGGGLTGWSVQLLHTAWTLQPNCAILGWEVCSWAGTVISYGYVTSSGHFSLMK